MLLGTLGASLLGKLLTGKVAIADAYKSIWTYWIALYVNSENVTCIDRFGVEPIPNEIRKFIGNKSVKTIIYRIQAYDSVMYGYFCIGFIDFMFKGKL